MNYNNYIEGMTASEVASKKPNATSTSSTSSTTSDIHQEKEKVERKDIICTDSKNIKKIGTSDPKIWGPQLWFILHNGASKYPISASPIYIQKMKDFIIGLPVMLPCEKCKIHAIDYIEDYKDKLDDICSGRDKLFKFFVDFHNSINKRYNKPEMDYEYVNKMY